MWGNAAEVRLNGSNRNASVRIMEVKHDWMITTVPKLNGDSFFFHPQEQVHLSFFLGQHVYEYDLVFENVVSLSEEAIGYRFRATNMDIKRNDRKYLRKHVFQEAILFNYNGVAFAHVLDRSEKGLRIQTWKPLKLREVELSINVDGVIETIRGYIKWHKQIDGKYQYGLQTN